MGFEDTQCNGPGGRGTLRDQGSPALHLVTPMYLRTELEDGSLGTTPIMNLENTGTWRNKQVVSHPLSEY